AVVIYANPLYWKQPYHTSALTGDGWVFELMSGHPERIRTELGVHLHVFLLFVAELRGVAGLEDSKFLRLEEQAAIFLHM
ncbi:hypothetical protein C8R44DRAFT_533248, partial [Mycena epipterygia]